MLDKSFSFIRSDDSCLLFTETLFVRALSPFRVRYTKIFFKRSYKSIDIFIQIY